MTHSACWGHPLIKGKTQIPKKLTIKKLSNRGLRRCTQIGKAYSNNEQKNNTFFDFAF